jgi:hypothetical protein
MPSPSEIASTGQSASQAPQEIQASVILYAILVYLLVFCFIVTHISYKSIEKSSNF